MRRGRSDLSPCAVMNTIGIRSPAPRQLQLEIWTTHPWQADIEDQAARPAEGLGLEERLSRSKRLHVKARVLQQVRQRLANRFVVVDDRNEWALARHVTSVSLWVIDWRCKRCPDMAQLSIGPWYRLRQIRAQAESTDDRRRTLIGGRSARGCIPRLKHPLPTESIRRWCWLRTATKVSSIPSSDRSHVARLVSCVRDTASSWGTSWPLRKSQSRR